MEKFNTDYQKLQVEFNDLVDWINETFKDSNIAIHVTMSPKDETELPDEKPKKIKRPEELTIGEQYVLFLLKTKALQIDNVDFDTILNSIVDSPVIQFLTTDKLNNISVETQDFIKRLISNIVSSIMSVDLSKLMEISPCDNCC